MTSSQTVADCTNCGIAVELSIGQEPPVLCAACELESLGDWLDKN